MASTGAAATHHVPAGGNIQQAIDNAAAGDTVQLAAGAFHLNQPLTAKSGVALVGAGAGQTTLTLASGHDRFISLDHRSNVRLSGFTLDGAGSTAAYGVVASHGQSHALEHLHIRRITTGGSIGIYFSQSVTHSTIAHNTIDTIGVDSAWGAAVRLAHGSSHNSVTHNAIDHVGRGGVLANDGSNHLVIQHNTVTRIGINNPMHGGQPAPRLGIEIWQGCDDSLIEHNTIDHWLSVDGSKRIAVRHNTIQRVDALTTRAFTALELAASANFPVQHVVLSGNRLVATADPNNPSAHLGLSISGGGVVEHALIHGNTIEGAGTWGVQIQGEAGATGAKRRLYFLDNTIALTRDGAPGPFGPQDGEAIRLNGDHGLIQHLAFVANTISNNHGPALAVLNAGNVTQVRFTDNVTGGNGAGGAAMNDLPHPTAMIVQITPPGPDQPAELSVQFAGDLPVQHALWDMGVGLPLLGQNVSFAFPAGDHTITVVAWDADGRASHATFILHIPEPSAAVILLGGAAVLMRRGQAGEMLGARSASCTARQKVLMRAVSLTPRDDSTPLETSTA
jgi:hypothetical protein